MADSFVTNTSDLSFIPGGLGTRCIKRTVLLSKQIVKSGWFQKGLVVMIYLNSLGLALETYENLRESCSYCFTVTDNFFLTLYTVEFILKVTALKKRYFMNGYHLFDFFILIMSFVYFILKPIYGQETNTVKLFGNLRALRILRTVNFMTGLKVLLFALLDTFRRWILNILILLFLIMFLFAIMGYYLFGDEENGDRDNWGSLEKAMLTLFAWVTVDGWTDFQQQLEAKGFEQSVFFTISFLIFGHFIFTNIFVAVVIMNISESTNEFRRQKARKQQDIINQRKQHIIDVHDNNVKKMLVNQKEGGYKSFKDMVQQYQSTLKHYDTMMGMDMSTNLLWMETFLETLWHMDSNMYRIQQLHFEMAKHLANALEKKLQDKKNLDEYSVLPGTSNPNFIN